jgi:hypothetical protein
MIYRRTLQAHTNGEDIPVDRETFDRALRVYKHRMPFRPFTLAMVNGDRLEVDYPDALAFRNGAAMYFAAGGTPVLFDHEGVTSVIGDLAGESPV